ncbi:MAG TPA: EAL domain-containing protein [Burkholderiaceae bacterium]|nr:EAL domain-containing protein [Burkholderiaceae bacterium]
MRTVRHAWMGAAIYLALGGSWIFFSDAILAALVSDPVALTRYQSYKGWFYVAMTALLAWWLLRRAGLAERQKGVAEQQTNELVIHAPVGIAHLALDGRFLSANPRLCQILGRNTEELQSLHLQDLTHESDAAADGGSLALLLRGVIEHCQLERRCARPDGSQVWVLLSFTTVWEAPRRRAHFVLVVQDIGEFKATQAALQASERRLRELIDSIPDGVAVRDLQGRYQLCNRETARILGLEPNQIIGRLPEDIYPEASAKKVRATDLAVLQAGHTVRRQSSYINALGIRVHLDIGATPLTDADGKAVGVLSVGRDLGESLRVRDALERSETSLRLALEGSGDGLWDWDLQSNLTSCSDALMRLVRYEGQAQDFLRSFALRDRLHPADREAALAAVRRSLKEDIPFSRTYRLLCFDGQYRWFLARGMRHLDAGGRPERFSGVLTDLTERRRSEEHARLAAAVVDNTIEGVLITDAQSHILSVNAAFTRLMGYAPDEVLGRSPTLLRSGRHGAEFFRALWASMKTHGHWQGEIWNRRKDGEVVPTVLSLSVVRDETNEVTHYVAMYTDISQQKAAEAKLDFLAHHDPLTGLPNRMLLQSRLEQALREAGRSGEKLAVLLLDLDRFKDVNDSYGHLVGDQLLQHVGQCLAGRLREADTLARLGGDEFALLMRNLHHDEDAARLADELMAALAQPWRSDDGIEVTAGASVGICLYPEHGQSALSLLQGADAALYRAKSDGRNTYRYFADEMTAAARERLQLESRLRRAVAQGQLCLHYQPQVELATGRIVGAEALVRWQDPEEGLILPGRFIPVAEATGLIGAIGAWVLAEACRQGRRWLDEGLPPLMLAVNVSPRQFYLGDLAAQVTQVLQDTGFPAQWLELEITEGALIEREQDALQTLHRLRALGVRLAIDDFGTGYSSLAYLKRFPLDVLKIDRSFIADIPDDPDDMAISTAIIALGASLGIKVLAEGVETQAQLDFLREKGCDLYQGYLISPALPPDAFAALTFS